VFENGVAVLGLGYIGLPTSAILANHGIVVKGVDLNEQTVDAINAGRAHIVEPDLESAVAGGVARGTLTAHLSVPEADAFLVAVPTPFREGNQPDLRYVEQATRSIAGVLRGGELVILESTSPPGTTRQMSVWLAQERPDLRFPHEHPEDPDVHLAHCPERVLPGRIMLELVTNDRLIGGLTAECARRAAELYRVFCLGDVIVTDAASAEMAKLVENSFRDVNIAFANELASVCEHMGLDVWEVIELANKHPRVNVLRPGPGVGGHCIAVDPWFIVAAAPEQSRLIRTAREVNDDRPLEVARQIGEKAAPDGVVACFGLAFKADVDDLRESPAIEVVQRLAAARPDLTLLVVDPHVHQLPAALAQQPNVSLVSMGTALDKSSCVALLVDHADFRDLELSRLTGHVVVDTRGLWRGRH
jgi:UDP-N-acetyl-D-mannosaminuronic acid dehydrogenase